MRITTRMIVDRGVSRLNDRLTALEATQRSLATGRRVNAPSADVAASGAALAARSALAANGQAQRNAEDGLMWANLTDSRLGTLVDALQRMRELAVDAVDGVTGTAGLAAIAAEAKGVLDTFVQTANARHEGRPLFGGFSGGQPVDPLTYAISPSAVGEVTRRISETETVRVNITAGEAFAFGGDTAFSVLDDLRAALEGGDLAAVGATLPRIDLALDRLLAARATIGVTAARVDEALLRSRAEEVDIRTQISGLLDTDLAEATMELKMQEVAYQAAQGALARALQPSLAAFLR